MTIDFYCAIFNAMWNCASKRKSAPIQTSCTFILLWALWESCWIGFFLTVYQIWGQNKFTLHKHWMLTILIRIMNNFLVYVCTFNCYPLFKFISIKCPFTNTYVRMSHKHYCSNKDSITSNAMKENFFLGNFPNKKFGIAWNFLRFRIAVLNLKLIQIIPFARGDSFFLHSVFVQNCKTMALDLCWFQ